MVDVYFVTGNAKAGKSATIRALTGARVRGFSWPVAIGTPYVRQDFLIHVRSLQEYSKPISPADFINEINAVGVQFVLAAVRYNPHQGQPNFQAYVQAVLAQSNFHLAGACGIGVTLSPSGFLSGTVVRNIPSLPSTTANQRAQTLRSAWQFA